MRANERRGPHNQALGEGNPFSRLRLPRVLGGIPLDTVGATGYGLAVCAEVAQDFAGFPLKGARVASRGLGQWADMSPAF